MYLSWKATPSVKAKWLPQNGWPLGRGTTVYDLEEEEEEEEEER